MSILDEFRGSGTFVKAAGMLVFIEHVTYLEESECGTRLTAHFVGGESVGLDEDESRCLIQALKRWHCDDPDEEV